MQCIYEYDPDKNLLFSEEEAGAARSRTRTSRIRMRSPCSATACSTSTPKSARRAPRAISPTSARSAIYSEEHVPDGSSKSHYNSTDPNKGHDHTFFIQQNQAVFAD
jgi:hypothetical protein